MRRIVFFTILYVGVPFMVCSFVVAKMTIRQDINKSSSVDVAKWDVAIEGQSGQTSDDKVALVAGNGLPQSYSLSVTNDSDVASRYSIRLSEIPDGVKVGMDGGNINSFKTPTNGRITFSQTGQELAPHDHRTHTLYFLAEMSTEAMNNHGISVDVTFTQEDPRQ
jgi:hypothetical protein